MSRKTVSSAEKSRAKHVAKTSRNAALKLIPKAGKKVDRRVRRTRDALGDALIALMQEKPFESVTVQQVLDRAGVGRSTFYAHFSDKNDLFLSDLEDFLEKMSMLLVRRGEASNRVAPVREMFAHVAEMRPLLGALRAADKHRDFLELGQEYFARAIDQRLGELEASRSLDRAKRTAMAHGFAGSLFSMMLWWLDRPNFDRRQRNSGEEEIPSPEIMDDLYHQMVWSGIAGQLAVAKGTRSAAAGEYPKAGRRAKKTISISLSL
jgi:AcrR family transcriptional regulator